MDWKSPPRHVSKKAILQINLEAMRTKLQTSKKLSLLNVENKLIMEIKSCPQYQAILRDLKINITTNKAAKQDGVVEVRENIYRKHGLLMIVRLL